MKIRLFMRKAVLFIMNALLSLGVALGTIGNLSHKSYLFALSLAIVLVAAFYLINRKKPELFSAVGRWNSNNTCIILSIICLVFNCAWIIAFRPVQAPDYQTFFNAAVDLANGIHPSAKDYLALFPHILGYSTFLGLVFKVFGQSIMIAAVVNVVLTTCSGILLYSLCLRFVGQNAAVVVFFLWIICPSKLLYNAMTLSEPYYTFLILLFFTLALVTYNLESTDKTPSKVEKGFILLGVASGIILTMVNAARPIGIIPIFAYLIWLMLLSDIGWLKKYLKMGYLYLIALLIVYIVTGIAWDFYVTGKLEQSPPSVPGYSIYVGFNQETQGSYSDDDMELLQSRYFGEYKRNAVKTQQSMLESAKDRISETKRSIPKLMIHKLGTLLGHDEGGAFYSKESMTDKQYALWCIASNTWYYLVCLLAAFGCAAEWRKNRKDSLLYLVPLCIIGVILAQLLVEVAARYHYCIIPMLLLMAASYVQTLTSAPG